MKGLAALHHYWFTSFPAERLAALRLLTGGFAWIYLLARAPHFWGYSHFPAADFRPVGIVALLDHPLPAPAVQAIFLVSLLSGAAFVLGWRYRTMAPLFALGFLWVTSYRSSWGMIFHQDNLASLHLLVLAAAPAAAAWSFDARSLPTPEPSQRFGWPVRAMCWLTVVAYVLAGIAKLKNIGWEWGTGDVLRTHIAYDAVRKLELGGMHSPLGAYLVQFDAPFPVLGASTLAFELGAPVALLGGRFRSVWVAGIWMFHLGVIALMAITFAYPVSGCAFASFFAAERLRETWPVRKFLERLARSAATS